jgi:transcriptional regulator with XRE-family HTH domain
VRKSRTKEQLRKAVGAAIKKARLEKGLSLKHFESLDGSPDRADLSRIENGQKLPSVYTLYKITQALEITS